MAEIQRNDNTQQQVATVPPNYAYQENSDAGTAVKTITFPRATESILIENMHATQDLYLYLRSGAGAWNTAYKTIAAGGVLSLNMRTTAIRLRGSGATTTYEILATLE